MSWPRVALGHVCQVVGGGTPKTSRSEFWGDGVLWVTPKDLSDQRVRRIDTTARSITQEGLKSCGAQVLPAGSVLLSSRAPIGLVAINAVPMATNQGFKSLVPDEARVHADYLACWLAAHTAYLQSLGTGATFKEISSSTVTRIEIPLPPLNEQRRIARVLSAADALRSKRRRALTSAGMLVQALFADMFGTADGAAKVMLADIVASDRPITYGILKPGPHVPDGVPYVRVVDIDESGIRGEVVRRTTAAIATEYRRSTLAGGDLVMSIRGHVGRLAVVAHDLAGANITQDSARLAISGYDSRYVMEAIRSPPVQSWMRKRVKGVAVQGINLADVKTIPIPQAPIAAQRAFSDRAAACDRVLSRGRAQMRHLDALFASLQHRAFTGAL